MAKKKGSKESQGRGKSVTFKLTKQQQDIIRKTLNVDLDELTIVEVTHYEIGVSVRGWPPAWGGCPPPPN